jgi:hypothetical protein
LLSNISVVTLIKDSIIKDNLCHEEGGAIYFRDASLSSVFAISNHSALVFVNSIIEKNRAFVTSGGISVAGIIPMILASKVESKKYYITIIKFNSVN